MIVYAVLMKEPEPTGTYKKNYYKGSSKYSGAKEAWNPYTWNLDQLKKHNALRKKHGVSAMLLDQELMKEAQEWSEY